MFVLKMWIFLMAVQALHGSPKGIKKRAHIIPPKSANSSDTQPGPQDTISQSVNMNTTAKSTKDICPSHLVPHNWSDVTVCCLPTFNCLVDHGIEVCKKDGEMDHCIPCPPFMVQKNNVSSLNMEEAECYFERNTENCPLDDTKPSRKYSGVISCLLKCECKNEECWYGKDPCACNLSSPCQINYTMNRETGKCERCPWYAYKDYVGCGTCTVIPELWRERNAHPTTAADTNKETTVEATKITNDTDGQVVVEKSSKGTTTPRNVADEPTVKQNPEILIGGLIGAGIVIVILIAVIVIVCQKRRKNGGSASQLLAEQNKPNGHELMDKEQVVELPDGYKTVGERPKIVQKPNLGNKTDNKKGQVAYEELGAVGGVDAQADDHTEANNGFEENGNGLHEEIPLLARRMRQNASYSQKQNVSNPDSGSNMLSDDDSQFEQSPLLNDLRTGLDETNPKGGARPKIVAKPKKLKRSTKSDSSLIVDTGVKYKGCTFYKCNIENTLPVKVSPIAEDSSLGTNESSDFSTFEPNIIMPVKIKAITHREIENERQVPCRTEGRYKNVSTPNIVNNDYVEFSEHTTRDSNRSELDEEYNAHGDGNKYMHVVESEVKNADKFKVSNLDNSGLQLQENTQGKLVDRSNTRNDEFKNSNDGIENNDNAIILALENTDLSLTDFVAERNVSQDLMAEDKNYNADLEDKTVKNLSGDLSKSLNDSDSKMAMEIKEGKSDNTSPRSSESEGDENKIGNGAKRKIKPFNINNNGKKPTAVIEPIRQNSRQDSPQEPVQALHQELSGDYSNSNDRHTSNGLYMSSLGSDSYPELHVYDPPHSDVGNLDELQSLNHTSISTDQSSSQFHAPESIERTRFGNLSQENRNNLPPSEQRQRPEGCSMPQSVHEGNYVQRPDIQRTHSKTVEETVSNLADTVARNLTEETFVKRPVSDSSHNTESEKKEVVSDIYLDDIDKEKLKNNSGAVIDVEQGSNTVIKADVEALETKHEQKSDNVFETASSQNENDFENAGESDSVELPNDCLANTEQSDSVEIDLVNSLNDLDSSLLAEEDEIGGTVSAEDKNVDKES